MDKNEEESTSKSFMEMEAEEGSIISHMQKIKQLIELIEKEGEK